MFPLRVRLWLSLAALGQLSLLYGLAAARFHTVHQRTFDLALYARVAWGFARADLSSQVLHMQPLGAHISPVLLPLGLLGRLLPTVHVLLFSQALCIALCVFPVARVGARHMGRQGIVLAVAAWLLYPNLVHVGSYEFHPGSLAVLPICWAFDALDRGHARHLTWACVAIFCCREDLGPMCAIFALLLYARFARREALWLIAGSLLYTAVAAGIVLRHAPENGSLAQHFGVWGGSPLGVVSTLFSDPARVLAHFRAPERLWYLPRLLALLSFFPLRAGRLLLPALPYLALNMLSAFPSAQQQYSHYLTPAVPALVIAGIVGVTAVRKRPIFVLWLFTLALGHYALGGSPVSRDFERAAFVEDAQTRAARAVLAAIPAGESVQAPDALLTHLVERKVLRRTAPPLEDVRYLVLDLSHRDRFARRETLLRTSEEPFVRELLARTDYGVLLHAPPYALLERGLPARDAPVARSCLSSGDEAAGVPLNRCLSAVSAALTGETLVLTVRATGRCPADLALRFGEQSAPYHVELLCNGLLSPALLQPGDLVRARYPLGKRDLAAARTGELWLGALRSDGKTLDPGDPLAVPLRVRHAEEP